MDDKVRRKQLLADYKQTPPEAGVYRITNTRTGRVLIGSAVNLAGMRNKFEFAHSANMPGALDHRLAKDLRQYGLDAFSFQVIETLAVKAEMTPAELREELGALEELWREQLPPELSY